MKKLIASLSAVAMLLLFVFPVLAKKPATNMAGAKKVPWNLSADVMPVPSYGTRDIPGSDTASKLIVNQPNGNIEVVVNGVMKGLNPDTTYTVYLSKGYTPYTPKHIVTNWTWDVLNGQYLHDMTIDTYNPVDGTFSGTGVWPSGTDYTGSWTDETIMGQITGNQMTFTVTYLGPYSPGSIWTVTGTIQPGGSVVGTSPWPWSTSLGTVIPASGSTGWPGLFTNTTAFTFMTDEYGDGNWHLNLRDGNFPDSGDYKLSVWINERGGTMLISDTFTVNVN